MTKELHNRQVDEIVKYLGVVEYLVAMMRREQESLDLALRNQKAEVDDTSRSW